jgi:hypothetical protein
MQPAAMTATKPSDDQDNGFSGAINIFPPTAAYNPQWSTTAWTGILLRTPYEKSPCQGFQPVYILL